MSEAVRLEALLEASPGQAGEEFFPQVAGALIGAAAADALGWITEFVRGREHLRKLYGTDRVDQHRAWQKRSGGRFGAYLDRINKGEYSDDTQLALAVARSLLPDGSVDIEHFAKRELPMWLQYARGAGATIIAAAKAISRKTAAWNANFFTYRQGGSVLSYRDAGANGAAMRVGPIALANIRDPDRTSQGVWRTSVVTHGHPRAILGALVYAEALRLCAAERTGLRREELIGALRAYAQAASCPEDPDFTNWLRMWNKGATKPFEALWEETRREVLHGLALVLAAEGPASIPEIWRALGCFERKTKGSGTGTVLAALVTFHVFGHDFREAVITAINQLGADTDTIGGFVGGLCGAYHGYENVPPEWASELQDYDYLVRVATELARVAARNGMGGKALLPYGTRSAEQIPNLLDRIKQRDIGKGERIYHPLFGTGWVEFVEEQALRRRDGAEAVFAHVRFDIGQSCKFRFIRVPKRTPPSARVQRPPSDVGDQVLPFDTASHEQAASTAERAGTTEQFPALDVTELGLLREIASGKGTRELAGELGISSREVVDRLRHLFRKLGAAEGSEALAEAKRRGLLEG